MGLAAPKNRSRISNDPQNTTWANNTSRFGHRILTTQGWTPGTSLGASNAAHASHYTAASHSHIRVLLKEDNLGLGATRGSQHAGNFGIAGLESVLGRLNGREVDVKQEQEQRADIERRTYVARKYGGMNFISGGFLVGDKIEKAIKKEEVAEIKVESVQTERKRKRVGEVEESEPTIKRKKKSMNLRAEAAAQEEASTDAILKSKSKKDKKDKKKSKKSAIITTTTTSSSASPAPTSTLPTDALSAKVRRKAARAERRLRKAEKRARKALKAAGKLATPKPNVDSSSSDDNETTSSTPAAAFTTGTSTPTSSTEGMVFTGRLAARAKFIRQKKLASMDPQALREILMIQAPS